MPALAWIALAALLLAACRGRPDEVVRTSVPTDPGSGTPLPPLATQTPPPTPRVERTLVVCMADEPATLYRYGEPSPARDFVLEAVYDGPVDQRSYEYQAVILEKLPTLENGDAILESIQVAPADLVVGADGQPVHLRAGVVVRPSGCLSDDCAVTYSGDEPLNMDRVTVTFRLLPGLTWSDGAPLTARDSVYAFESAASPETPVDKFLIERTASYQSVDERTVIWQGLPGYLDPSYVQNFWSPLPEHAWGSTSPAGLLQSESANRSPLGWGPYVVQEWVHGEQIRLARNSRYYRAAEGLPAFDHLLFRFVGQDPDAALSMLLSGECDFVAQGTGLIDRGDRLLELAQAGQVNAAFVPGTVWEYLDFGIAPVSYDDGWQPGERPDYFGNPLTRKAIALCMDRQAVVDAVMWGLSPVPDTYLAPEHPLSAAEISSYGYDVDTGGAYLQEAGWNDEDNDPGTPRVFRGVDPRIPPGTPLEINYWASPATQRAQAAQILADSMANCGIKANLQLREAEEVYASGPEGPIFGRQFDLGQLAWQTGFQPACNLFLSEAIPGDPAMTDDQGEFRFPYGWGGWNATGYADPTYDAACEAARSALPGMEQYREAHRQSEELFAEQLPGVPLYRHLKVAATRPDLCGFALDPTENALWNLEAFDYGDGCLEAAGGAQRSTSAR